MNRPCPHRRSVPDAARAVSTAQPAPLGTHLRTVVLCLLLIVPLVATADPTSNASPKAPQFRVGLSAATLGHVNRNDVMAAMKFWTRALLTQRGIDLTAEVRILEDSADLLGSLNNGRVDSVSLSAEEYLTLPEVPPEIYVTVRGDDFRESYVLLVRCDTGYGKLADLRGSILSTVHNQRMLLAPTWLETLLGRQSLGRPSEFFESQVAVPDHSKAILSVFFRKAAACITTTNALALAAELNPQVRRDTLVLEASPPLVPGLFFLRRNLSPELESKVRRAILTMHEQPTGRQVLTVFQADRMERQPASVLSTTADLLAGHARFADPPWLASPLGAAP